MHASYAYATIEPNDQEKHLVERIITLLRDGWRFENDPPCDYQGGAKLLFFHPDACDYVGVVKRLDERTPGGGYGIATGSIEIPVRDVPY